MREKGPASAPLSGKRVFEIQSNIIDGNGLLVLLLAVAIAGIVMIIMGRQPETPDLSRWGWAALVSSAFYSLITLGSRGTGRYVLDDRGVRREQRVAFGAVNRSSRTDYADIKGIVYFQMTSADTPPDLITRDEFMNSSPAELELRGAVLTTRSGKDITIGGTDCGTREIKEILTILEEQAGLAQGAAPGAAVMEAEPPSRPASRDAEGPESHSAGEKQRNSRLFLGIMAIPLAFFFVLTSILAMVLDEPAPLTPHVISKVMRVAGYALLMFIPAFGLVGWFNWGFIRSLSCDKIDHRYLLTRLGLTVFILALPLLIAVSTLTGKRSEQPADVQEETSAPESGNAPADASGSTPLVLAVYAQDREQVRRLLKDGANPNEGTLAGYGPLSLAVDKSDKLLVQLLLANKADPNQGKQDARPCDSLPLQIAINKGQRELAKILLRGGANANSTDSCGLTPLMTALRWTGNEKMVHLLLQHGADVNLAPAGNNTPLIRAAGLGDGPATALLIKAGAEVDRQDSRGWTALMHAAGQGSVDLVKMLLNAGARVDSRSSDGVTVLQIAENNGHQDVAENLKAAGAR